MNTLLSFIYCLNAYYLELKISALVTLEQGMDNLQLQKASLCALARPAHAKNCANTVTPARAALPSSCTRLSQTTAFAASARRSSACIYAPDLDYCVCAWRNNCAMCAESCCACATSGAYCGAPCTRKKCYKLFCARALPHASTRLIRNAVSGLTQIFRNVRQPLLRLCAL